MPVQTAWLRDRQTLDELVRQSGLTERELARQASLSHSTVTHLLSGRRRSCSPQTAKILADVLGADVWALFIL